MKNLIIFILLLFSGVTFSQSVGSLQGLTKDEVSINQISPGNAYFGATLSNTITGDNLADNFLFNANFLYDVNFSAVRAPIIADVALPLTGQAQEISIGVFPWSIVSQGETTIVAHGGAEFGVVPGNQEVTPNSMRLLAGVEAWIKLGDKPSPLTVSLTPVVTFYNMERDTDYGLELTAIAPLTAGLGILVDVNQSFRSGGQTVVNAGIVVLGAL